jgi:hypothetical protein
MVYPAEDCESRSEFFRRMNTGHVTHYRSMSEQNALWIVVEDETEPTPQTGIRESIDTGGTFGGGVTEKVSQLLKKRVPVDAVALKAQMTGLLKVVGDLFEEAQLQTGMCLSEVDLVVEINAEGQVSLVGTGGKVSNKGGITLKFKRLP